eukprot:g4646.t1
MTTTMRPLVIVDCDPGIDDAQALSVLFHYHKMGRVRVLAVCAVAGNVGLGETYRNAAALLDAAGLREEVPLFPGASGPLIESYGAAEASFWHGKDGFADIDASKDTQVPSLKGRSNEAASEILSLVRANPGQVTLIALGPLTNVATALLMDKGIAKLVKKFVFMGASLGGKGNITPTAEFNAYADPESLHIALRSFETSWMCGWQCTLDHPLPFSFVETWLAAAKSSSSRMGNLISMLTGAMVEKSKAAAKERGWEGYLIPDPLAMCVALEPTACRTSRHVHADVELGGVKTRGMLVVDDAAPEEKSNLYAVTSIDVGIVQSMLMEASKAP